MLTVFCYHDVSNSPSEFSSNHNLNVSPEVFEFQIRLIKKYFNIIGPGELQHSRIPKRAALITFDDGFKSFFLNAIPILEKYQVPSLIFLNMEPVKGKIFWSGLITYLCEKRPDFAHHLKHRVEKEFSDRSLFLLCSNDIVMSYLEKAGENFEKEVSQFVGAFADEYDLKNAARCKNVYFGNHLFNHHVPLLMSDNELLQSFEENDKELGKYPNYINMFSFPFGQQGTCFSDKQVELLLEAGVKKIFHSSGTINSIPNDVYLDRIALSSQQNSLSKFWFYIVKRSFRFVKSLNNIRTQFRIKEPG
jgi:peptidoglycan/xylan/chitin deacetylase (PgdA/CDA1 family)